MTQCLLSKVLKIRVSYISYVPSVVSSGRINFILVTPSRLVLEVFVNVLIFLLHFKTSKLNITDDSLWIRCAQEQKVPVS